MRLLDTSSLQLREFFDDNVPSYAILSHTWGDEEVSLEDFAKPESRSLSGFSKIEGCCALAKTKGWQYVWIDTCCIDRKSSAELSEAINSMYRWYRDAQECFAYFSDIKISDAKAETHTDLVPDFEKSRWFTRGWTLQELLAPSMVIFFDRDWNIFGTRTSLKIGICNATRILSSHLTRPESASIAQKMSWVSLRKTSRKEDMAYCLLGLCGVNMPLLYGEGERAFARLQHEIIRISNDESIFAWRNESLWSCGMLAKTPRDFVDSGDVVKLDLFRLGRHPYSMTNQGLDIELLSDTYTRRLGIPAAASYKPIDYTAPIACARISNANAPLQVHIRSKSGPNNMNVGMRTHVDRLEACPDPDILRKSGRFKSRNDPLDHLLQKRFFIGSTVTPKSGLMKIVEATGRFESSEVTRMPPPLFIIRRSLTIGDKVFLAQDPRNRTEPTLTVIDGSDGVYSIESFNQNTSGILFSYKHTSTGNPSFGLSWSLDHMNQVKIQVQFKDAAKSYHGWFKSNDKNAIDIKDGEILARSCHKGYYIWISLTQDSGTHDNKWIITLDVTQPESSH